MSSNNQLKNRDKEQFIKTFKPVLPHSNQIYYKDFHFLDEPLINKNKPKAKVPEVNTEDVDGEE